MTMMKHERTLRKARRRRNHWMGSSVFNGIVGDDEVRRHWSLNESKKNDEGGRGGDRTRNNGGGGRRRIERTLEKCSINQHLTEIAQREKEKESFSSSPLLGRCERERLHHINTVIWCRGNVREEKRTNPFLHLESIRTARWHRTRVSSSRSLNRIPSSTRQKSHFFADQLHSNDELRRNRGGKITLFCFLTEEVNSVEILSLDDDDEERRIAIVSSMASRRDRHRNEQCVNDARGNGERRTNVLFRDKCHRSIREDEE